MLWRIGAAISDRDIAGVVLRGPVGVGKSRIAREALAEAARQGAATHWVIGTATARSVPAGAFAAWAGQGTSSTLELVRNIIDALTADCSDQQVVVGVDDVHLLDDLSTFILRQVIERRIASVVVTFRDGDPLPAAALELWSGDGFELLQLAPLTYDDTFALLTARLGTPPVPSVAQNLWTLTQGNALYLHDIVEQELNDQRLILRGDRWEWTGEPVIAPNLVDMIESRIGSLPKGVSDVIDVLAVGEPLELAALCRITDQVAVEEADRRRLITLEMVDSEMHARLAHPLYGEVRRHRAPTTSLRRLRGLVVGELAKRDGSNHLRAVVQRASLSIGSDLEPDADLLLDAARAAVSLADLSQAERLAATASRAGAGPEADFIRAHVLSILSRGHDAISVLDACTNDELTVEDRAKMAFLRSHVTLFTLKDPAEAKRLIDEISENVSPDARKFIDAFLALYWAAMGRPLEAIGVASAFALDGLPGVIGAGTAMALAVAFGDAGRVAAAEEAARTGYALAQRDLDAAHMRFLVADGHIGALVQAGQLNSARHEAERLHAQASDLPGIAQLFTRGQVGIAALAGGDLRTACDALASAVEGFDAVNDTTGWGYRYSLPYTVALALNGKVDAAVAALAAATERRHPAWPHLDHEFAAAQAWVAAAQGTPSIGITIMRAAAEVAKQRGQLAAEVMCGQVVSQLGDRSWAPRLKRLAELVEGPRAVLAARFASALHDKDGEALAALSAEYENMGDRVMAVDAAVYAADFHRHHGRNGSAYTCAARAEEIAATCRADTPAMRTTLGLPQFTTRELEIIALIRAGMQSRAIATTLTLSVRTVEGHIYRAMARTGASSRTELVAMLGTRKPTVGQTPR